MVYIPCSGLRPTDCRVLYRYKKQSCNHAAIPYLEQVQTLFRTVSHGLYTLFRAEAKN